jgi:hypothetical protein
MGVVIVEGKVLQTVIGTYAKIVGHPLPYARRTVVRHIRRNRSQHDDQYQGNRGRRGYFHFCSVTHERAQEIIQPVRQLVLAHNVVENDLQRPGSGHGCDHLQQHGQQDDQQGSAVRLQQTPNKRVHTKLPSAGSGDHVLRITANRIASLVRLTGLCNRCIMGRGCSRTHRRAAASSQQNRTGAAQESQVGNGAAT